MFELVVSKVIYLILLGTLSLTNDTMNIFSSRLGKFSFCKETKTKN